MRNDPSARTAASELPLGDFGPGGVPRPVDEVDEKLLALPVPPRAQRWVSMGLMAVVVALAIGLLFSLRADVRYFFASDAVVDLGDIRTVDPAVLEPNRYVRVEGIPMASRMVHYSRVLTGGEYVVFPLAGQRTIFVQVPTGPGGLPAHFSRREFSGRLVTFQQLGGRFRAVQKHIQQTYEDNVTPQSFLIMADEPPGSYGWALVLAGLCILFIVLDVWLLLRWFRPLPYAIASGNDEPDNSSV